MEAVTTCVREWRDAAMATDRSMEWLRRPPSRFPRVFVALGRISSVMTDSDSTTLRTGSEWPGNSMQVLSFLLTAACNGVRPQPLFNLDISSVGNCAALRKSLQFERE